MYNVLIFKFYIEELNLSHYMLKNAFPSLTSERIRPRSPSSARPCSRSSTAPNTTGLRSACCLGSRSRRASSWTFRARFHPFWIVFINSFGRVQAPSCFGIPMELSAPCQSRSSQTAAAQRTSTASGSAVWKFWISVEEVGGVNCVKGHWTESLT